MNIHVVVLQSGLPSLDGKLERFVTKKWEKRLPNSIQTDYRPRLINGQKVARYFGRRALIHAGAHGLKTQKRAWKKEKSLKNGTNITGS